MRTAPPQSDASTRIRSITWRVKEDRSGPEYRQELLLLGLLQFQRQQLAQVLHVLEFKKLVQGHLLIDSPDTPLEEIEQDVEGVMQLFDSRRRFS